MDNIKCDSASNVFSTGGNNIVEVFDSLTTSFWTMDTLFLADI